MSALPTFHDLFTPPDPALRQPFTGAAASPLFLSYYAMAVLVILPHTFVLKLSLLPFLLWQAWKCAVGLNFSAGMALAMGVSDGRLGFWNLAYVTSVLAIAMRSTEWAFTREPLKRYEPLTEGQQLPVERPLTIPNVLLDACELQCNPRGIRWSWGSESSLRARAPPPPVAMVTFKMLFKLVVHDIALCIMQRARPLLHTSVGGSIFDPDLDPLPRVALAAFLTFCTGIVSYTSIDVIHHMATLIGRVLLRQPATDWPAISARPWTATSITDFWSFRWHQCMRHTLVSWGARPSGALLGRPGVLLGAFTVSAVMHYVGMWGLGKGMELNGGAFFIHMGVGALLEHVWQNMTGARVRGLWGWVWTMSWTLFWGTSLADVWARHGVVACDSFIPGLRLGKPIVDGIVALITKN